MTVGRETSLTASKTLKALSITSIQTGGLAKSSDISQKFFNFLWKVFFITEQALNIFWSDHGWKM
ncbi:hypothetical protein AAY52_08970 [Vibrio metoecus]|nr:hypothetical protein AAY52_08970 [Vibrio metoecus]